jgi:hypothetical protein
MFKWLSTVGVLLTVIGVGVFLKWQYDRQFKKILVVDGSPVTVAVYKLPEPLKIDILYKGEMDLDAYSWIRPLMFQVNAFELTIPESDWPKYVDVEFTKERYEEMRSYAIRMTKAVEENPGHWGCLYNEITHVVWCRQPDAELLSFHLVAKKENGEAQGGSRYEIVYRVDGKWKRSGRISSRERVEIVYKAHEMAMKAVEEGTLKVRSAKGLK